jgi:peroxiredoxin
MLLSDAGLDAARGFGVAWQVDDGTVGKLREYDIDIEAASGEKHHWLPVPSLFLVDTEGRILFQYVNPDYKVRIHPDVLLAAARAYAE